MSKSELSAAHQQIRYLPLWCPCCDRKYRYIGTEAQVNRLKLCHPLARVDAVLRRAMMCPVCEARI